MYVVSLTEPARTCPACNTSPVLRRNGKQKRVICPGCRLTGRWAKSVTGAVRRWNNEILGEELTLTQHLP